VSAPVHARRLIDLGSVRGLLEHDHELRAYCPRCDRWAELDLGAMVRAGRGNGGMQIDPDHPEDLCSVQLCRIRSTGALMAGGRLRHAAFVRVRPDKEAGEVRRQ
jgi:hypothetical protein